MKVTFLILGIGFLLLNISHFSYAQNDQLVVLETTSGNIVIEFFPDDAPKTVENFLNLTKSGFYDGTIFHRVIKNFMIQGGDPLSKDSELQNQWGTGGPDYMIEAEFNTIKHNRGIISMARMPTGPDTASSQFFIVHADSNFLDEQYTVFGRIVTQESFDTLDKIASLETGAKDIPNDPEQAKILTAKVVQRSEIPDLLELGEPERVLSSLIQQTESEGPYVNERLGISLTAPTGWVVQEPQKTSSDVPDLVFVGPAATGEINPVLSIGLIPTEGKTLQQHIEERKTILQPAIDEGILEMISDGMVVINGKEAWEVEALGKFQSGPNIINVRFAEVIFPTFEKFYIITYTNSEENFENYVQDFENAISSFTILSGEKEILNLSPSNGKSPEGGGCLIATAAYDSELSPQVQLLREIRDNKVLTTESGSSFMAGFNSFYYSFSPTIADWERQNPLFKETIKLGITPLLASLSILNYVNIDSEYEMLGYGIGIILMNVGMYFVAPTLILYRLRK